MESSNTQENQGPDPEGVATPEVMDSNVDQTIAEQKQKQSEAERGMNGNGSHDGLRTSAVEPAEEAEGTGKAEPVGVTVSEVAEPVWERKQVLAAEVEGERSGGWTVLAVSATESGQQLVQLGRLKRDS